MCEKCGARGVPTFRNAARGIRSYCGPCVRKVDPGPEIWWQCWKVR